VSVEERRIPENPIQYGVFFQARDERLRLLDSLSDGRAAEAYVIINTPNGGYVERDILRTGSQRTPLDPRSRGWCVTALRVVKGQARRRHVTMACRLIESAQARL
jgi:hypothetical protein